MDRSVATDPWGLEQRGLNESTLSKLWSSQSFVVGIQETTSTSSTPIVEKRWKFEAEISASHIGGNLSWLLTCAGRWIATHQVAPPGELWQRMQCAGCNDVLMQWKITENYSQMFWHKLWDSAIYVNMTIWLSISLTWTRLLSTGRLMMLSRECLWVLESISSCLAWATTFWGLILSVIGLCRNGQEHGETLNRSNSA